MGCDIGGTFTDFVIFDDESGTLWIEKCLTTPADPAQGVLQGVAALAKIIPDFLAATTQIFHGTTLVINAVLERKGAKTALITTEGFRDVLEIGSERRYDLYDLQQRYPPPLVPRHLRLAVPERARSDGKILTALDMDRARAVVTELQNAAVESVAVCLLHAYVAPKHEQQLAALLAQQLPQVSVSLSSQVLPEINEYTRTTTTVVNAYCKPLMARYLSSLQTRLVEAGFGGQMLVMLSSGGVTSVDTASRYPVRVIESGPVGGVIMSQHVQALAGIDTALAFDMGGTTAKICVIEGGTVRRTNLYEVARVHRFKEGSGIPIEVPCIDLLEVGAGGGSIASVNELELLQVGPHSAGAQPGPACYGHGGMQPTVTDADLLLGYLDPNFFLGGAMALDVDAARHAIDEQLGAALALTPERAAWGIHDAVNESMASAAKMYAAERGVDPSALALVASGGAGPVHCFGVARKLGITQIVIPVAVGVACALGFLVAPVSYDLVRTHKIPLAEVDLQDIDNLFGEMQSQARSVMAEAGELGAVTFARSVDVRYVGQGYEVNVALPASSVVAIGSASLGVLFQTTYETLFDRVFAGNQFELVNLRLVASGPQPASPLAHPLAHSVTRRTEHGCDSNKG
ncbi:MAG: N-methylhydantoinase A, partial [Gammaproteobacteria bacterium]